MIAVDTNLLVYAHRRESPFHDQAQMMELYRLALNMPTNRHLIVAAVEI